MNPPTLSPNPATIRRGGINPMILLLAGLVLFILLFVRLCSGGESKYEKMVRAVTEAVQKNDMTPVDKDFNPIVRVKLTRVSVAQLSDEIAPLGKIKHVQETSPKEEADKGHHTFVIHFDKGDREARMGLDSEGRIDVFRIAPAK